MIKKLPAWVYKERLLSLRVVLFAGRDLEWEYKEKVSARECGMERWDGEDDVWSDLAIEDKNTVYLVHEFRRPLLLIHLVLSKFLV